MRRSGDRSVSHRLLLALLCLALFVAFELGLFGWLIFRSLSQREIEQVLLATRQQAETLAERIVGSVEEGGEDLYTALATERETRTYINSILQQRDLVQNLEIRDTEGVLVFKARTRATIPNPEAPPPASTTEVPPQVDTRTVDRTSAYQLEVPIGDVGIIHIGISQQELEERIGVLRRELIRQASFIGVVTTVMLCLGGAVVWWLWRRAQRLEARAREQERLAYLGTLASGLAHEIRNPLNSLSLNMQLIEEEVGEVASQGSPRGLLAITRAEIARLERLVTDFLSYARPHAPQPEDVKAVALLERARSILEPQIRAHGAAVRVVDQSAGACVHVDAAQLVQLLINLVQNSLAATEDGERQAEIQLSAKRRGNRVVLQVTDNGCGIPPEERDRIFDLFYSTRKGGTGLGLAIVERIARAHQGELEVVSMRGAGTTIRLVLRGAPSRATVPVEAAEPRPSEA